VAVGEPVAEKKKEWMEGEKDERKQKKKKVCNG